MASRRVIKRTGFTRRELLTAGGLVVVAGLVVANEALAPVRNTGSDWSSGVPIPVGRSEMPAAVIDGKIYVTGGFYDGTHAYRFDPVTRLWTKLPNLPVAVHHPGVAALDGRLYVAGGYSPSGHNSLAHLWSYEPQAERWSLLTPLPVARGAFGLVALNGALYAAGGALEHLGGSVSGDLLRYDAANETWEPLSPLPTPREHLAVVASDGKIYAIGGRANGNESAKFGGANEQYDPLTDSWATLPAVPVARSGLAGVAVDSTIVVIGGERGRSLYNNVNRFNPETGGWDTLSRLGTARHGLAGAFVDGTLYAIAGSTLAGSVQNTDLVETLAMTPLATPSPSS